MLKNAPGRCVIVAALCVILACGSEDPAAPLQHAPDVALVDVNPNSSRHDESISPRDYMNQVSVWYFGHAT